MEVRELEKGVWAVTGVNAAHPAVRALAAPAPRARPEPPERDYSPPLVREMLCVTAHVQPLFPHHK